MEKLIIWWWWAHSPRSTIVWGLIMLTPVTILLLHRYNQRTAHSRYIYPVTSLPHLAFKCLHETHCRVQIFSSISYPRLLVWHPPKYAALSFTTIWCEKMALLCVGEWTQVWFSNTITGTHLANGGQGSIPALILGTFSPLIPDPSSFCGALMSPHQCTPATVIPVGWNQGHDQTILASMLLLKVRLPDCQVFYKLLICLIPAVSLFFL